MIVLQASKISKYFGDQKILEDATIALQNGEKTGLVGPNGAGKTTLLKILAGEMTSDYGEVYKSADVSLGYLPQQAGLFSGATVIEEMYGACQKLIDQEKLLREYERQMGDPQMLAESPEFRRLSDEYAHLSEDFRNKGGYEFRSNIKAVLNGLNFGEEYHHQVVDTLSGGQKTRLALARLLIARPDVLTLDEPTNHLDLETLSWLEKYLLSYPGAVLVVSHDRYFLDSLVTTVYELERGKLNKYPGNYSRFVELRTEKIKIQTKQYQKQQEEIARTEDFIRRNIARASTTGRAQSRRKALEKMDLLEKPVELKSSRFSFDIERQSGREVLAARKLAVGYGDMILAQDIELDIQRADRIALVGPNGIGKSTLLKTLAGQIRPLKGHVTFGSNVIVGYYDQEQTGLTGSHSVLDELWGKFPYLDEKDVRGVLGNFLFSGDDVYKSLDQLSGGERSRLALADLMLRKSNFLLLDEPTNHLDLYSREVLEEALSAYEGTILFVSHDRYFLNKLAQKVVEITPAELIVFTGNYDEYMNKRAKMDEPADRIQPSSSLDKEQARLQYLQNKEAQRLKEKKKRQLLDLEASIEAAEARITILEKEVFDPEVYQNLDLLLQKNTELEKEKSNLAMLYEHWESVMNQLNEDDESLSS